MSRPRSRSPHYRRFPWEEHEFGPDKTLEELQGNGCDRSRRLREEPEEPRDVFREDFYPERRRRSPPFLDDHQFNRHHSDFHHGRPAPRHDAMRSDDQRLSPPKEGAFDVDRHRGRFREPFQKFEGRGQRQPGMGWRREEQDRGQAKFRDPSPSMHYDDQRGGGRGRRATPGPHRGRQRENPHHKRGSSFHRPRREMDDADHLGYRDKKDLVDTPRGGFGGGARGTFPRGDFRHSGSHFIEHKYSDADDREMPPWQRPEDRRPYEPHLDRQRSPRSGGSSQERFRTSDRPGGQEETQAFHDALRESNLHEARRSPGLQDRPHTVRYGDRDGHMSHRGRGGATRSYSPGGRTRPPRARPHPQESSQGYQDLPRGDQRPFMKERHGPLDEDDGWNEDPPQQWERPRSGGSDQYHRREEVTANLPRQRERDWSDQKADNMTVVTEETLTIKVDMSQPVNQSSSACYSSDRQLSLDLVNVGRQRLDFLPMLKHSGTYRETANHTGTFAQEIITLVHLVKDQYFRGEGVSLNERFSAPAAESFPDEAGEELTLNQRFSSSRGFSFNSDLGLEDDDEAIFSRLGPAQGLNKQPLRGPGDLRHDLERRRQERLEGVKVTILGTGLSQPSFSEPDVSEMDHERFSDWSGEHGRRRDGNAGPRRGPSSRMTPGPQSRSHRFSNQRPNVHSHPAGAGW
ncbi:BCLAF1 and THRAP3 family member 3 [Cololabis saira]|uniref:BCLAF1 and THRAP3 family member 3 n=1 Tax=Cololabis saira TaxID=129043 RepID=UPI002AD3607F|nr:BCLAF1 and THRAP3 family member 3 [Cololabis saira]